MATVDANAPGPWRVHASPRSVVASGAARYRALETMKVRYNAPVVLTFTLLAVAVQVLGTLTGNTSTQLFAAAPPSFHPPYAIQYLGLVTHPLGHAGWSHLFGNFMLVLLLGPLLEERHGSWPLLQMMLITALVTGLCNALFFDTYLVGASGIVFMFILLGSMSNFRRGEIPLTFVLVAVIFLGRELVNIFQLDEVSQFAHIAGGLMGAGFGFARARGAAIELPPLPELPEEPAQVGVKPR